MPECSLVPKSYSLFPYFCSTIEFNPYLPFKFLIFLSWYIILSPHQNVHFVLISLKGHEQLGKAFDIPPTAVLSGLLLLVSYRLSHCVVKVPRINWVEPVLLWLTICMPTGSGKTPLFTFLIDLLQRM